MPEPFRLVLLKVSLLPSLEPSGELLLHHSPQLGDHSCSMLPETTVDLLHFIVKEAHKTIYAIFFFTHQLLLCDECRHCLTPSLAVVIDLQLDLRVLFLLHVGNVLID